MEHGEITASMWTSTLCQRKGRAGRWGGWVGGVLQWQCHKAARFWVPAWEESCPIQNWLFFPVWLEFAQWIYVSTTQQELATGAVEAFPLILSAWCCALALVWFHNKRPRSSKARGNKGQVLLRLDWNQNPNCAASPEWENVEFKHPSPCLNLNLYRHTLRWLHKAHFTSHLASSWRLKNQNNSFLKAGWSRLGNNAKQGRLSASRPSRIRLSLHTCDLMDRWRGGRVLSTTATATTTTTAATWRIQATLLPEVARPKTHVPVVFLPLENILHREYLENFLISLRHGVCKLLPHFVVIETRCGQRDKVVPVKRVRWLSFDFWIYPNSTALRVNKYSRSTVFACTFFDQNFSIAVVRAVC